MQLGLGTAQFGLDYGVSNRSGRVPVDEVARILELARCSGVDLVDTAPAYGSSEEAIGTASRGAVPFRVVTKTPVFASERITDADAKALAESFGRSRTALRADKLHGLLFHRADDIVKPGGRRLIETAQQLVADGALEKIGVSVYSAAELERVLAIFAPDIVQVPVNVFDQRLVRSGHLERLRQSGAEIHVRSVFLQGLLLMEPDRLPRYFDAFESHLGRYFEAVAAAGCSALEAALTYVRSVTADAALIGVTRSDELRQALSAWTAPPARIDFAAFAHDDPRLLNPSRWKLAQ